MHYDDIVIKVYKNSFDNYQMSVEGPGFSLTGASRRELPLKVEDIAAAYARYQNFLARLLAASKPHQGYAKRDYERLHALASTIATLPPTSNRHSFEQLQRLSRDFLRAWGNVTTQTSAVKNQDHEAEIYEFGRSLLKLLPDELFSVVLNALRRARQVRPARGLRVIIEAEQNAREVLDLPWELVVMPVDVFSDPTDRSIYTRFLFLNADVVLMRQVRHSGYHQPITRDLPLRTQIFVSQPSSNAPIHTDLFLEALTPIYGDPIDRWWSAEPDTLQAMRQRLQIHRPQILQLICHGIQVSLTGIEGKPSEQRSDMLLTYVDDEGNILPNRISAHDLIPVLGLAPDLQIVLLTVCSSSGAQTQDENSQIVSNIAYELVRLGIPMVIGMQGKLAQGAAACFSAAFYASLQRGETIDHALADARIAIKHNRWPLDWFLPVVYRGSHTVAQSAWHIRLADGIEEWVLSRRKWRGKRAALLAFLMLLTLGSLARLTLIDAPLLLDGKALRQASIFWSVAGIVWTLFIFFFMRSERRHLAPKARTNMRNAQAAGALLGYTLTGVSGFFGIAGCFFVVGNLIPSALWWSMLAFTIVCSCLFGYVQARVQARQVRLDYDLYPTLYGSSSWLVITIGMLILLGLLPVTLLTSIGLAFAQLLTGHGSGGFLLSAMGLAMLFSFDQEGH